MKGLKRKLRKFFNEFWPLFVILAVVFLFFWKFFINNLIPLPADFVIGTYYPWLDYKWGYSVGVPVKNPITSDVVSVIYPLRMLAVDMIKNGQIPLWNPHMFAGYPLLANFQVAILSPTVVLYFLFSKITAWSLQVIAQVVLSSFFTYLLLRYYNLSKFASLFGGLVFAFSGFNIIWLEWNTHALTAAFIPLIILISSKFIDTQKLKYGVFLSLSLCLQIFSGYPQLVVYTLISVGLLILLKYNDARKILFKFVVFGVLGLILSSSQLVPAVELLMLSQRKVETLGSDLAFLPWQNLVSLFAPDYFGNHATGNFWGIGNYTNNTGYTGLVTFLLAIVGYFTFKKNKYARFFAAMVLVSLLISLPFPWSKLLVLSPFFGGGAASMTRALVLANFGLACLSAYGIDAIYKNKDRLLLKIGIGGALFLLVLSFITYYLNRKSTGDVASNFNVAMKNLVLPASLSIAFLGITLVARFAKGSSRSIVVFLMVVISIAELFRFGWKYTPFSPKDLVFPKTPVIEQLEQLSKPNRVYFDDTVSMNMWVPYSLDSLAGYDAVYPLLIAKYISVLNSDNPDSTSLGRYGPIRNIQNPLFDLANNKFIVQKNNNPLGEKSDFEEIFTDKSVRILLNKRSLPRAFFVSDWETVIDDKLTLSKLLEKDFTFENKIILSEEFDEFERGKNNNPHLIYQNINNNEYKISIDSSKNGFLFVSDTFYPGWKVYIDGNITRLYRANYTFKAVPVTKGKHNIRFIYDPESFKIGSWLSFATLTILLLILIFDKKKAESAKLQKS